MTDEGYDPGTLSPPTEKLVWLQATNNANIDGWRFRVFSKIYNSFYSQCLFAPSLNSMQQ
jgi:hypothetical protein